METREADLEQPALSAETCLKCGLCWLEIGGLDRFSEATQRRQEALRDPIAFARGQLERVEQLQRDGTDWVHGPIHDRPGGLFNFFTRLPVKGFNPVYRFPIWTRLLVVILVLVFAWQQATPSLVARFALVPPSAANGLSWERLFGSIFLHADIRHLLANIAVLWVFGDNVEDRVPGDNYISPVATITLPHPE